MLGNIATANLCFKALHNTLHICIISCIATCKLCSDKGISTHKEWWFLSVGLSSILWNDGRGDWDATEGGHKDDFFQ